MENSKKIAILTGATGGLGYVFLKELEKEPLDEIWTLGRNTDRLEKLSEEFGKKIVTIYAKGRKNYKRLLGFGFSARALLKFIRGNKSV